MEIKAIKKAKIALHVLPFVWTSSTLFYTVTVFMLITLYLEDI